MKKRVLVIDDNPTILKTFALALEDTEFDLDAVDSGEKGIARLQKSRYDLIFLDLKMPGINGVDTLREIRKMDTGIPVYIITAFHGEFVDALKGLTEEGMAFELLKKPIGLEEIRLVAESILNGGLVY